MAPEGRTNIRFGMTKKPDGISGGIDSQVSGVGLIVGTLFLAASLTPSLIPRSDLIQGVLAGVCFAAGYALAIFAKWVWAYVQLPEPPRRFATKALMVSGSISAVIAVIFLFKAADWQNEIRAVMGIAPVPKNLPIILGVIATGTAITILAIGALIMLLWRRVSSRLANHIRPRLARILGLLVVIGIAAALGNGILLSAALRVADSSAQALDELIEPETAPPEESLRTGSPASLIAWDDLGREGRDFISSPVSAEDIQSLTGQSAIAPVRVYAGLGAADDPAGRAALAVAELERVGGFDRSTLVIAMPTGTGWMDPAAFTTLEYLHHGDVATVAIQYSYLQSWLSLLVEPEYSVEAGRALFTAVYSHWKQLPEQQRPNLYLYGLSLGAYSSQQSLRLHEIIDQPLAGALWVGPPFVSPLWQSLTAERHPGSPSWLPRLDEGQLVRFTNGLEGLDATGVWGRMRIVYLQYASDPIVFFQANSAFRQPDWMDSPRGPDVSPSLRWYPIVSFLQQGFDMAIALAVPMGHGHLYAYTDHIAPWVEVTQPAGWDELSLAKLRAHLSRLEP